MSHVSDCPKCFGAKVIMEPRVTKGFKYVECSLCGGEGTVLNEIAEDYIFSITEENFDDEEG